MKHNKNKIKVSGKILTIRLALSRYGTCKVNFRKISLVTVKYGQTGKQDLDIKNIYVLLSNHILSVGKFFTCKLYMG